MIRFGCWLVVVVMLGNCIYAAWNHTPLVLFAVAGLAYAFLLTVDVERSLR